MKIGQKVVIMDTNNLIRTTEYEVIEVGKRNSENDDCVKLSDGQWYFSAFCVPTELADKYRPIFQNFYDEEETFKDKKMKAYTQLGRDKRSLEL